MKMISHNRQNSVVREKQIVFEENNRIKKENKIIKYLILLTLLTLVFWGCSDNATEPTETYGGDWSGTTSQSKQIGFKVEDNKITSVTIDYNITGDGCSTDGLTMSSLQLPAAITENAFSFTDTSWAAFGDAEYYTLTGTFSSTSEITGTLTATWLSCGTTNATWTASKN